MIHRRGRFLTLSSLIFTAALSAGAQQPPAERVRAITPPATPLPPEAESRGVTKFSFFVYGDTRGRRDGIEVQYEHSLIVDSMLARIRQLSTTPYPVRFVIQSGDAVLNGRDPKQWNVSFTPLIDRLTRTRTSRIPRARQPRRHLGADRRFPNARSDSQSTTPSARSSRRTDRRGASRGIPRTRSAMATPS